MLSHNVRGWLNIHAVPFSLSKQVGWTISRELGTEQNLRWLPQSAKHGQVRVELDWQGSVQTAPALASALAGWGEIWFEIAQEPGTGIDGGVWLHTPALGLKYRCADSAGNILVGEHELAQVMSQSGGAKALKAKVSELLAEPWLNELEPLRRAVVETRAV